MKQMGIMKIGRTISGSSLYSISEIVEENNAKPVPEAESSEDIDDCEIGDINCELGMVEGQLCDIPYELYDLPNLREILCLETWNSCLTEEERISLSAYLPDMDQQTFWLTMKELFGGSDIYFGNPVDILFKGLKGGCYPPKVTYLRKCLQFMERRRYYHLLRSYHDNMVEKFVDMRRMWDQCERTVSIQKRVYMWTIRRTDRGNDLLDLNRVPEDGSLSCDEVKLGTTTCPVSKRARFYDNGRAGNVLPSVCASATKFVAPHCGAKGVLKVKAAYYGSFQDYTSSPSKNILARSRRLPRGVLKISPEVPSFQPQQSMMTVPGQAQPTLNSQFLPDCKFSCLPESLSKNTYGFYKIPFLGHKGCGGGIHTTQEQPPCTLSQQDDSGAIDSFPESYKIKIMGGTPLSRNYRLFGGNVGRSSDGEFESSRVTEDGRRYNFGGENLWRNLSVKNEKYSVRPLRKYPFDVRNFNLERCAEPSLENHADIHPRFKEVVSRIPDIKQDTLMASSSDQVNCQTEFTVRKSENLGKRNGSQGLKDENVLPLTYKRRKTRV